MMKIQILFLFYLCGCENVVCSSAFTISSRLTSYKHCRSERPTNPLFIRGGDIADTSTSTTTPTDTDTDKGEKTGGAAQLLSFVAPVTVAFDSIGRFYANSLSARPIITKSITAGITFFLSDYTAQYFEKRNHEAKNKDEAGDWTYSWTRTLMSTAVGLFYFGPAAHAWYEMIFKLLPGNSLLSTVKKAALGQAIFGPTFTSIFFASTLLQTGDFTLKNWGKKIVNDLPGAWMAGVGYWPLVDLISFAYIPVPFIPLFINICSFVWTIYLSIVANRRND